MTFASVIFLIFYKRGGVAERLGSGLQIHLRGFEFLHHLHFTSLCRLHFPHSLRLTFGSLALAVVEDFESP